MTVDAMNTSGQAEHNDGNSENRLRRQRRKNYALMAVLLAWVIIIYLVAILRIGGAS